MGSKIIFIRRKFSFIEDANADPAVKDYFDMSFKAIGSQFKVFGKIYESGLTSKEEEILMPEIIGFFPSDRKDYRGAVQDYYKNMNTKIPSGGFKMEVGLEGDGPLATDNMPLNIDHYLRYRHALKHVQVGKNLDEAEKYQHILFYVDDPEINTKHATKVSKTEDAARMLYFKIIEDKEAIEMVLTLLGIDTKGMNLEDRILKLKSMATIKSKLGNAENVRNLDRFVRVASDKNMAAKYEIERMIAVNILDRIRTAIVVSETGDPVGDDMKSAVHWFKDKSNSKEVNVFRAQLREFGQKEDTEAEVEDINDDNYMKDEVVVDGIDMDNKFGEEDETE
jgi:hypothetical protein